MRNVSAQTDRGERRRRITAFPTLSIAHVMGGAPRDDRDRFDGAEVRFLSSARAAAYHTVRHFQLEAADTILVPAYHCGVEIEALVRAGVKVELYDVGRDMRVRPEEIRRRIRPGVKALFAIHYWGFPQDVTALADVCREHNLILIEDCAHALFSADAHGALGGAGHAALYSLPKSLPVPNGGILRLNEPVGRATPDEPFTASNKGRRVEGRLVAAKYSLKLYLEHLRSRGRGPLSGLANCILRGREYLPPPNDDDLDRPKSAEYYGETPLSRYDESAAPLARRVFRRADGARIVARRRQNYARLVERLQSLPGVDVAIARLPAAACPLFCPVFVTDRPALEASLFKQGIETFVFGRRLHPMLDRAAFPDADYLSRHLLALPVHDGLDAADMNAVADAVVRHMGRTDLKTSVDAAATP